MKKSRFTDEQVIGLIREAEGGMAIKELCRLGGYQAMSLHMRRSKSDPGLRFLTPCACAPRRFPHPLLPIAPASR